MSPKPLTAEVVEVAMLLLAMKGLNEQKSKPDNPSESGDDIDRITPFELRAERCRGERHTNGHGKSGPDQRPPS